MSLCRSGGDSALSRSHVRRAVRARYQDQPLDLLRVGRVEAHQTPRSPGDQARWPLERVSCQSKAEVVVPDRACRADRRQPEATGDRFTLRTAVFATTRVIFRRFNSPSRTSSVTGPGSSDPGPCRSLSGHQVARRGLGAAPEGMRFAASRASRALPDPPSQPMSAMMHPNMGCILGMVGP